MPPSLTASPGNPLPENRVIGTFVTRDGLNLRYGIFRSSGQLPLGTIVIHQGRNESIEKYAETIADLNAMGLWVATWDCRGQGESPRLLRDPRRGHIRRFSDLESDLECFLEQVVLPDAKLPFFLLGHSMGGLVALAAAPRLANRIERMVVIAPFLGIAGEGRRMFRIRLLSKLASSIGLGFIQFNADVKNRPFKDNKVTSDPVRYARNGAIVAANPKLGLGPPTARWLSEMIGAMDRVDNLDHLGRITIPTLILAPTQDKVVPFSAMEELSKRFRASRLIPVPGSGHEILQERDIFRAQAFGAIKAFIPGSDAEPFAFVD